MCAAPLSPSLSLSLSGQKVFKELTAGTGAWREKRMCECSLHPNTGVSQQFSNPRSCALSVIKCFQTCEEENISTIKLLTFSEGHTHDKTPQVTVWLFYTKAVIFIILKGHFSLNLECLCSFASTDK